MHTNFCLDRDTAVEESLFSRCAVTTRTVCSESGQIHQTLVSYDTCKEIYITIIPLNMD